MIELLVVISIIGILLAAGGASWNNAQQKGRDAKRKSDLKGVQQALELYLQTYGVYPTSASGNISCSGGSAGSGTFDWSLVPPPVFQCPPSTGPIFMQQLPKDPSNQSTNGYYYANPTSTTYILSSGLENTNDPDIAPGALLCTPQSGRNYCVINP